MDIKKILTLIESVEEQKQQLTEGKNMAQDMVMQHYAKQEIKTPIKNPVSKLNEYFKVVDNEMLNVMKEEQEAKKVEVKRIVDRVLNRLDESKKAEAPKPRNFVAKNAMKTTSGAGAHRDKKKEQKQGYEKHKNKDMAEGRFGRSNYYNPMDYERDQQDQMDWDKRAFKRAELQHELGHEDTPEFKRMMRERDRGPWYLKIDGKILKQKGEPKVFDWRKGANNYALAILKNKPELEGKIFLTKKLDDETESLNERAVSKAQQRFMGMVHAAKKGEKPASPEVAKVAKGMSAKAAKDFAKTKHKGLPDKKTDEGRGASKKQETEFHAKLDDLVHDTFGKRKGEKEGLENPKDNPCWKGYKPVGTKKKNGKTVPNCVPKEGINEAAAPAATSAAKAGLAAGGKLAARAIPGVGLGLGAYDAWDRFKKGDYVGAGLSAGAGLAGLVPGVGTAAATGMIGAQLARDYAKGTGTFAKDEPAQGQAATPAAGDQKATAAAPAAGGSAYTIQKGDNLTKIAKANNTTIDALMKANPQIKDPNKIYAGAKLNIPSAQTAAPATAAPAAAVPKSGGTVDSTRTTTKTTTQTPPAETPKQAATPAPSAQPAPGANIPNTGASVTDRKVTQAPTTVTKQGNVTTTTSGSSASGTLKGITQDMIVNHPVYKAEMAKVAGKSPMVVNMTRDAAIMKAKNAILKDPSYLQNYKAPAPQPTGNAKMDNF